MSTETGLIIIVIMQGIVNGILLNIVLKNQGFIVEKLSQINKKLNNHGKD